MKRVRVRFAPVPSESLHINGAHVALFNWLFARKEGGEFILRFEDIGQPIGGSGKEGKIVADLRWLKLEWEEGPDIGGAYGPYKQSLRLKIYQRYAQNLVRSGAAYPCYCLPGEVESRRAAARRREASPPYDNRCRTLSAEKKRQFDQQGRKSGIRFQVPPRRLVLRDLSRGKIGFDTSGLGDFILVHADGTPSADFARVLDDCLMEVTHVIRSEEHLSASPRQMLLFEALGFPLPQFAHVPLILRSDRGLLDRKGDAARIESLRGKGYLPEAVVNYLLLLGWAPPEGKEIFDRKEMIERFSPRMLSASPAIFDWKKFDWVASQHIRRAKTERLAELALPFLKKSGVHPNSVSEERFKWVIRLVAALRGHLRCLSDLEAFAPIFCARDLPPASAGVERILKGKGVHAAFSRLLHEVSECSGPPDEFWERILSREALPGLRREDGFAALRVAITGREEGPDLKEILPLIPLEVVAARLKNVLKRLKSR